MSVFLRARGLTKTFGGVTVLEDASVELRGGEIHALVGENGAGKSTLAKLLAGVHTPTAGTIEIDGQPVTLPHPRAAAARGIALIHQEPLTFPDLSVAENIFVGRPPLRGGRIDWRKINDDAARLLESVGAHLDPKAPVRGLSIADQQMIELAAALSQNARALLLDETTASLTPGEVERLAGILRRLQKEGVAIAFIGHRLEEIFALCDRITILRDGRVVGERVTVQTSVDEILTLMVGRGVAPPSPARSSPPLTQTPLPLHRASGEERAGEGAKPAALEVRHLCRRRKFDDISFSIRAGEVVGLAGLVGAGRTEVARALFGLLPIDSGEILRDGVAVRIGDPRAAMGHGIALVPEDRQHHGVFAPLSLWENATLPILSRLARRGWVRDAAAREAARTLTDRLRVRCRDLEQPIHELSGGNQQKIVLARWLLTAPKVLLLDEPTRGVDVGAKAEVHRLIAELAAQGLAVLLISSDLPEVLAMADRVLVMRAGKIVRTLGREEATPESVIGAASGAHI